MAYRFNECVNCGKVVGEMAEHSIEDCIGELRARIEKLEQKLVSYYNDLLHR